MYRTSDSIAAPAGQRRESPGLGWHTASSGERWGPVSPVGMRMTLTLRWAVGVRDRYRLQPGALPNFLTGPEAFTPSSLASS